MSHSSQFLFSDFFKRRYKNHDPIIETIKNSILFRTLSKKEVNQIKGLFFERVYEPGEFIFKQNEKGFGMYMIIEGRISIRSERGMTSVDVIELSHGSFFGELALIEPDNLRSASAVATERTVLVGFFQPQLQELMERKPEIGSKILFQLAIVLGKRLILTTEKLAEVVEKLNASEGFQDEKAA
jgi:CRP/FNR family cyclic AMP-dependent transcriptional regulator